MLIDDKIKIEYSKYGYEIPQSDPDRIFALMNILRFDVLPTKRIKNCYSFNGKDYIICTNIEIDKMIDEKIEQQLEYMPINFLAKHLNINISIIEKRKKLKEIKGDDPIFCNSGYSEFLKKYIDIENLIVQVKEQTEDYFIFITGGYVEHNQSIVNNQCYNILEILDDWHKWAEVIEELE